MSTRLGRSSLPRSTASSAAELTPDVSPDVLSTLAEQAPAGAVALTPRRRKGLRLIADGPTVDTLIEAGRRLLRNDPEFQCPS